MMTRQDGERIAVELMKQHGLKGWVFEWGDNKTDAGHCIRANKVIKLSWPYMKVNGERLVREVMLHEIAHALTVGGHTEAWRVVAKSIGSEASTKVPKWAKSPGGGWRMVCRVCGQVRDCYRKPRIRRSCAVCCPSHFDERYLLTVEKVGGID